MQTIPLAEYRCACGKLLFKGVVRTTRVQIKCKRCSALSFFGPEEHSVSDRYGMLLSKDGTIMAVSETVSRILGYTPEELRTMNMRDVRSYARDEEHLACTPATSIDETHRCKDGRLVSVRVRFEIAGTDAGSILCVCDVYPQDVLNDAPHGPRTHECVAEVDVRLTLRYVSEAFARALESSAPALVGAPLLAFLDAQSANRCRFLAGGSMLRYAGVFEDVRFRDNELPYRLHSIPAWRDDGTLRGYTLLLEPGCASISD